MNGNSDFPALLSAFFSKYLIEQRHVSAHTIASYRDTLRLLVLYAKQVLKIPPQKLSLDDLDVEFFAQFLNHLERHRGNTVRTRNVRLATLRSFFRFVILQEPRHAALAEQVLAMPIKRHARTVIEFLERTEIEALIQAPDRSTRIGRRDYALLIVAIQTGLRASELMGLCRKDVHLNHGAHVQCFGKGRKSRCIPLRKDARTVLKSWLNECPDHPDARVFTNQRANPLTHDSLDYLLKKNLTIAQRSCPTLQRKNITPHSLRHYLGHFFMSGKNGIILFYR